MARPNSRRIPEGVVELWRGDLVESCHRVLVAVSDATGRLLAAAGDPFRPVWLRSSAKPFQAAAAFASGAFDDLAPSDEEVAIACGSHGAEEAHLEVVRSLLARLGLDEGKLLCGTHPPLDPAAARRVGDRLSPIHHNCSGSHAAMLALAVRLAVPVESYLEPSGPVQRRILEALAALCDLAPERIPVAPDGCSALTFALPLRAAATAFARLARPEKAPPALRPALSRIAAAMGSRPWYVAGTGRFDTLLAEATGGRLVAKSGAEGVQGVADRATGLGLFLKVADGASRAVAPAALEALRWAGMIDDEALARLEALRRPALANHAGRVVGRTEARVVLRRAEAG
jgi:L-asparaginase II